MTFHKVHKVASLDSVAHINLLLLVTQHLKKQINFHVYRIDTSLFVSIIY